MQYIATRPRVQKRGTHGLFSSATAVDLASAISELEAHEGNVWTIIYSLRREDAARLEYDNADAWRTLLMENAPALAKSMKISLDNFHWYAAFHNESHHPHVHLVVYSSDPSEGYLTAKGIDAMRSAYAHDIFRQEFLSIYEKATEQRNQLKEQAEKSLFFLLQQMQEGVCHHPQIAQQMQLLSRRLKNTGGKKVYGYLKADVKAIVNDIVDELAKEERVAECYQAWLKSREEIQHYYKDSEIERIPLSQQKELKSIKNMVIREAVRFGEGYLYLEEAETGIERLEEISEQQTESLAALQGEDMPDIMPGQTEMEEQEPDRQEEEHGESVSYFARWTDRYKEAREYLYGTMEAEPDEEAAHEIMLEEAEQGNAYAMHDMGKIYAQGIGCEADKEKADVWYQKALAAMQYVEQKKKNTYLEYRIGKMHQYGLGTEEDFGKAAEWFQRASDKNHKYAQYSLAMLYRQGKGVPQDDREAHRLFQCSHKQGNAYASYELAKMYEQGIGIPANPELATDCYRVAFLGFLGMAKKGKDDTLLYRIGAMYLHGKGTEPEEAKAVQYFEKSAEYGNVHAKYQLARIYLKQEKEKLEAGQPAEEEKVRQAIAWLTEFADQGNDFAAYALGSLYLEGVLTERDTSKAILYLTQAADQNHVYAQLRLGKLYLTEECQDITKAIHYLKLAANQGNSFAAYRLGRLYLLGEQVQKDVEQAVRYLLQSADAGNSYAQYAIGKLYLIGKEIPQDKEKAEIYLTQAAEQGNQYAAYLLEHWQEAVRPDVFLMTTRLLRHLGNVFADESERRRSGSGMAVDRKLRRKIREKKIAQGHAEDDHAQIQTM